MGAGVPQLGGTPVVVGGLHSQVGVIAAVVAHLRPGTRVSYVMTDGAALPMALSDLVAELAGRRLLDRHRHRRAGLRWRRRGGERGLGPADRRRGAACRAGRVRDGPRRGGHGHGARHHRPRGGLEPHASPPSWVATRSPSCAPARPTTGRATGGSATTRPPRWGSPRSPSTCRCPPSCRPRHRPSSRRIASLVIEPLDVEAVLAAADLRVTTMGRGPADDPGSFRAVTVAAQHAVHSMAGGGTVGAE